MTIDEILKLSQFKPIAEIAKEHLAIGEKPTRNALKYVGCHTVIGKPGWFLNDDTDESVLSLSIYEIADQLKEIRTDELRVAANVGSNLDVVYRKRHSFDLDVALVKKLKLHSVKNDITLYEAVEDAIREYLNKEGETE